MRTRIHHRGRREEPLSPPGGLFPCGSPAEILLDGLSKRIGLFQLRPSRDIPYRRWKAGTITGPAADRECGMPLSSFRYRAGIDEKAQLLQKRIYRNVYFPVNTLYNILRNRITQKLPVFNIFPKLQATGPPCGKVHLLTTEENGGTA